VFEDVKKKNLPPPIFLDAVLFYEKKHSIASIGGAGYEAKAASVKSSTAL
jgi:hypothetical protein